MSDELKLKITLEDDGQPAGPPPTTQPSGSAAQYAQGQPAWQGHAGRQPTGTPPGPSVQPSPSVQRFDPSIPPIRRDASGIGPGAAETGAAEGGAGAAGGAAGALGPIAAAAAAAKAAFDAVTATVTVASNAMARLAGNDNLGGVIEATNAAASAMGKIPVVGQALEGSIKAVTAAVGAFSEAVDAFVRRGQELAKYSGTLSLANAQAGVKNVQADVREARELEEPLARLTTAQNELSIQLRDLLLPVKKFFVESAAGLLETLTGSAKDAGESAREKAIRDELALKYLEDIASGSKKNAAESKKLLEELRDLQKERENAKTLKDNAANMKAFNEQIRDLERMAFGAPGGGGDAPPGDGGEDF